jgi:hypothetical protein
MPGVELDSVSFLSSQGSGLRDACYVTRVMGCLLHIKLSVDVIQSHSTSHAARFTHHVTNIHGASRRSSRSIRK